jgi:hypothetical protein
MPSFKVKFDETPGPGVKFTVKVTSDMHRYELELIKKIIDKLIVEEDDA